MSLSLASFQTNKQTSRQLEVEELYCKQTHVAQSKQIKPTLLVRTATISISQIAVVTAVAVVKLKLLQQQCSSTSELGASTKLAKFNTRDKLVRRLLQSKQTNKQIKRTQVKPVT